jgi:RecA-family ATPase
MIKLSWGKHNNEPAAIARDDAGNIINHSTGEVLYAAPGATEKPGDGQERPAGSPGAKPGLKPLKIVFEGEQSLMPAQMLVKRLIPFDGVCFVGGQSGAGKTFMAVHLAVCLDTMTDFFGFKVKERVASVFLVAEGDGGLQRRFAAAKKGLDLPLDHPLAVAWHAMGAEGNLSQAPFRARVILTLNQLKEQFQERFGVRLGAVLIDTFAPAFMMKDENSPADTLLAIQAMREISKAAGVVVMPVDHFGKSLEAGLRGTSAKRGART